MDIENIKRVVSNAMCAQFEMYSWENMIDDCDLTEKEAKWANEHLSYKLDEF